jgi:hypothetical protein
VHWGGRLIYDFFHDLVLSIMRADQT